MNASDVMTRNVVTVAPDATVEQVVAIMLQHRISGVPVMNAAGVVVGMVTEGDLLRRVETGTERHRPHWLEILIGPGKLATEYVSTHTRKVRDVMTAEVVGVEETAMLGDVVELMERHRIKRVPVFRAGKLAGIISRANLLQGLASATGVAAKSTASDDDAALRQQILAEIDKQPWAPRTGINVVVRDGIVHLWGAVLDDRERQGLRVLAENVSGVRQVRDHISWIEPMSGFAIPANEQSE
jgi:CBS domain-containing protein